MLNTLIRCINNLSQRFMLGPLQGNAIISDYLYMQPGNALKGLNDAHSLKAIHSVY